MSYDLAVWEGDRPDDDEAAAAEFEAFYERHIGSGTKTVPAARIAAYVSALLERYPDVSTEAGYRDSPWASAPLMSEASGPLIYLPLVTGRGDEVAAWAARVAEDHGLVCFDPQTDQLRTPWATPWRVEFTSVFDDCVRNPDPELVHSVLVRLESDDHFILLTFADGSYFRATCVSPGRYAVSRAPGQVAERSRTEVIGAVDDLLGFVSRRATKDDLPALKPVIEAAIGELQKGFLDPAQIESSRAIMGLDTQLIDDGTYFVVLWGDRIAGCGGWSRRATLYGGDHSAGRDAALLDPATEPAKVRAMYTHPGFARRGVGRLILERCEHAARREGFRALDLMGTLAGRPLYEAAGFRVIEELTDASGGVPVPLVRMRKPLV